MDFFDKVVKPLARLSSNSVVVDRKQHDLMQSTLNSVFHSPSIVSSAGRATLPMPYLDTPTGSKVPLWKLHPQRMFELAENVGDIRTIFETIQREMFKNGVKVRPKFRYKCNKCHKTFKERPLKEYVPIDKSMGEELPLKCDECGNDDQNAFSTPDPDGRITLQTLVDKYVNNNDQDIVTVSRQYERDLDTVDYAVCVALRNYKIQHLKSPDPETGATKRAIIDESEIDEILRVHPAQTTIIANNEARMGVGNDNQVRWICPNYEHRDKTLSQPICDKCGCEAFTAIIETNAAPFGMPVTQPKQNYYAKHEVILTSGKYYPDLLYGNSPLNAIWRKVMSLYHQDEYLWKYFDKDRPPKSILAIGSRNYETVQSFFERQRQGARADPYMPRPILLNTENVSQALQHIDLTPNFKELELSSVRQEMRQMCSSIYGIQPVYYGEQTKAGIGNESMQVTITNRTIKTYQKFLNKNFFDKVAKLLNVDDWEIALIESEEIDIMRDEQIKGTKIDNASKMYSMGFDVYTNGDGEFIFSQFPNPERQQMMNGMGENVKRGNTDKVKSTKPSGEKSTNFGGEPKLNRPSDMGGAGGGSPSSDFSFSKKSDEETLIKARDILKQGAMNGWTLTTMSKNLAKSASIDQTEALNIVKFLIMNV